MPSLSGALPLMCENVREVFDIRGFIRIDIHQANGFQMDGPDRQREESHFSGMTRSRKKGSAIVRSN